MSEEDTSINTAKGRECCPSCNGLRVRNTQSGQEIWICYHPGCKLENMKWFYVDYYAIQKS